MATNLLAHIADDQLDASVFNTVCHSVSLGPVTAKFCINTDPLSVAVTLTVAGVTVANCAMSSLHPTCKIGGGAAGFKGELDLTLDIPGKKLNWSLTFCAPFIGCKTISGSIPF